MCPLLGANGVGKSTLLRLLSGLEEPDSGSVFIGGLSFRDHGVRIRRNLGVLPEGLGLFESLTVIENLMVVGPIYGLTMSETAARAADLLHPVTSHELRVTSSAGRGFRDRNAAIGSNLWRREIELLHFRLPS